jgi:GNAT superfamily N-acetyltransferase
MSDDPQQIVVTQAQPNDVAMLAPLFDGYRVFYNQASDRAAAQQFIGDRLATNESVIFIARLGDHAVGFTQLFPSFSSVVMQRIWILNDLFVSTAARGQGVGEALLRRAEQFARETQAKRLVLSTATDNIAAQRLYEKLGWQRDTVFFYYELSIYSKNKE